MKTIVFGATGMVGQGVLRECLLADDVTEVLAVGRTSTGETGPKLRELIHRDFTDFTSVAGEFRGYDACFFCLGVSSVGMKEPDYRRITYDFTMAAARPMAALNPGMTFIYVSGEGTDSSEKGRSMWARVKGETENAVIALPFHGYAFRPGFIQPKHGVKSKTGWYRAFYTITAPVFPVAKRLVPGFMTTTEEIGRAMLRVAREHPAETIFASREISALGR